MSNILIVDDKPDNLELATEILEDEGIKIRISDNGKEALKIAEKETPDLILLDIAMPEIDGFETCKRMKQNAVTRDIPIIFVSARNDSTDVLRGFEVGAVDYVHKPFNALELLSRVKTHLELKKSREQLVLLNTELENKVEQRTIDLKQAYTELQKANNKLEYLDKAKSEFLSLISHELRTPLNGIMGYSSLIKKSTKGDDDQKLFIDSLNKLINSLVKISEISLLFTELRASNYVSKLKPVLIEEVVHKALEKIEAQKKEKQIEIRNNTVNSNLSILTDTFLLNNCIEIILDNAVKYSPAQSLITISSFNSGEYTIIEIRDQGPGFSEEALKNLFEVFKRDNFNNSFPGFGIGMATVKLILDSVNGHIDISNMDEGGASVKIRFSKLIKDK